MPLADMPMPGYAPPPIPESIAPPMQLMGGFPLEEENPVFMQNGGLVNEAMALQQAGRGGDNMLVHMNPQEVGAINQMGNAGLGGLQQAQMTINPQTGLPEMFSFKEALPTIAGIVGGMFGGPVGAGLASGATSMVTTKGDVGRSLMAGLGAWGGGQLMQNLSTGGQLATGGAGGGAMNPADFTPSLAKAGGGMTVPSAGPFQNIASVTSQPTQGLMAREAAKYQAGKLGTGGTISSAFKGLGNIGSSWTGTGTQLGMGDVVKPGFMALAGTAGSMPPPPIPEPEEYESTPPPPPADYGYTPPPPGYRPGIDPQWDYYQYANEGGYVNDLPTIYANSGIVDMLNPMNSLNMIPSSIREKAIKYSPGGEHILKANERLYDKTDGLIVGDLGGAMGNPFRFDDDAVVPEEDEGPDMGIWKQRLAEAAANQLPTVNAKFGWKDAAGILSPAYMMHKADLGPLTGGIIPSFLYDKFRSDDDNQPAPPAEEEVSEEQARALMSGMGSGMGMNYQMEGGTRGDVVLPTVNAKFGLKDLGMAVSPAYALGRGGIKGLLSRFSPAYMLAKGRYGPEEEEPIDPEDIDEANAMMMPPQANVSGGQMYMKEGTKDKTVKGKMTDEEYLDNIEWEPDPDDISSYTGPLERMTDAQLTSALRKEGLTPEQIKNYIDPSPDYTEYNPNLPIVSKREGGLAMGGGVVGQLQKNVGQLQDLGGQAQEFSNSVQSTLGGGGGQLGRLGGLISADKLENPDFARLENMQSRLEQGTGMGARGELAFGPQMSRAALFKTGSDGMVVDDAMSGVMSVASPQAQDALAERMAVPPAANQPQNPEERAIYDSALLALQGMLEGDAAQMAIDEFIETFGAEAYRELEAMVANEMDNGGVVEPANGETTVAEGKIQGPDVIPGKIVDPVTGEQTANLRVGENEYIEPADSLERRAMAAGLPPSPQNGARVRGEEEKQLEAMYG